MPLDTTTADAVGTAIANAVAIPPGSANAAAINAWKIIINEIFLAITTNAVITTFKTPADVAAVIAPSGGGPCTGGITSTGKIT